MAKRLLIIDDEEPFLTSLHERLLPVNHIFTTDLSTSVDQAIAKCAKTQYDLIITDIFMPGKTGLDLLLHLKKKKFQGDIMAMTAAGDQALLDSIKELGGLDTLVKPFDFDWFKEMLVNFFQRQDGFYGTIDSIDLTTILQVIHIERKTAAIQITIERKKGYLYFEDGEIVHAEYGSLAGEKAAKLLIAQNRGQFSLLNKKVKTKKTISTPFAELIMSALKEIDEKREKSQLKDKKINNDKEVPKMAIKDHLALFSDVSGYLGGGVFTPQGEMLEGTTEVSGIHFETAGSMIHDMLLNAKKMAEASGFGNCDMIQLDTEMGVVLAKCFNDGTIHYHTVLVIKKDGNVAMAKMKLKKVVELLKPEF
jgi:response regulator of citrate/malate metabolism